MSINNQVLIWLVLLNSAHAAVISSTFDTDDEGWIGIPGEGSVAFFPTGGNPGGHIRVTDIGGGGPFGSGAIAPPKFRGDLSEFDGGILSVDLAPFAGGGGTFSTFGIVRISGGGDTALLDLTTTAPSTWQTFSGPLTAAAWGKTSVEWMTILAGVTEILIATDAFDGPDTIGIDNFTMSEVPIPEPGSLALVAGAAAVILFIRPRSRRNRTTPI
jgi:hypothetical protein